LAGRSDGLVDVGPLLRRAANFADLLDADADDPAFAALRRSELIGRPLGSEQFVADIERELRRKVRPGKRGRRPKDKTRAARGKAVMFGSIRASRANGPRIVT
jgi:putative transposase